LSWVGIGLVVVVETRRIIVVVGIRREIGVVDVRSAEEGVETESELMQRETANQIQNLVTSQRLRNALPRSRRRTRHRQHHHAVPHHFRFSLTSLSPSQSIYHHHPNLTYPNPSFWFHPPTLFSAFLPWTCWLVSMPARQLNTVV